MLLLLVWASNWRTEPIYALSAYWTLSLLYLTVLYCTAKGWIAVPPKKLLILGLGLRGMALFCEPAFTDDLYRYQWEGRLQASGGNPYSGWPAQPQWAAIAGTHYSRIEGKTIPAIYGPVALLAEHASAWAERLLGGNALWAYKLPAFLADCTLLWLVIRGSPAAGMLYALCPLAIIEFSGMGHNDALLVLLLYVLYRHGSPWALGLAIMTKWWPLLLAPAYLFGFGWRKSALAALPALLLVPFATNLTLNADFATGFLGGWQNNAGPFLLLAWLAPSPDAAKVLASAWISAGAALLSLSRTTFVGRALATTVWLLAWSANVHAWYITWLLPVALVRSQPPGQPTSALLIGLALPLAAAPILHGGLLLTHVTGTWQTSGWWSHFFWIFAAAAVVFSWRKSRQVLEPSALTGNSG